MPLKNVSKFILHIRKTTEIPYIPAQSLNEILNFLLIYKELTSTLLNSMASNKCFPASLIKLQNASKTKRILFFTFFRYFVFYLIKLGVSAGAN